MIRVLMLDLGDTLIRDEVPLPHVVEALGALTQFETASGDPLAVCLVSDFTEPDDPPKPGQIEALFQKYLAILDRTGLRPFFEPVERHVTLSTQAGAPKPKQKIFDTAIERLGVDAGLEECLFITEDVDHIKACRQLGMKTITFGQTGRPDAFDDWSEGPLLIARLIAPESHKDLELALKARLAATHGMEMVSAAPSRSAREPIRARVKVWHALSDPSLGDLDGVRVELPADAQVHLDERGGVDSVREGRPSDQDVAEATHYVRGLAKTGKIVSDPNKRPLGATHEIGVDAEGRRYLKRKRFSAL